MWNETLLLTIYDATQSFNLTVYDEDVSNHDVIGSVVLPISHMCAGDLYNAKLTEKGGKSAGYITL